MKRFLCLVAVLAIVTLACSTAFAAKTVVVEARVSGGAQNSLFTFNGLATTSAKATGLGLTGTGSYYAGDTTPAKYGDWKFNAGVDAGYYDVFGCWASNAYAASLTAPTWTIHSADADATLQLSQSTGANTWQMLAAGKKFNASTDYTVRLTTAATSISNKRTYFDSVKWVASTPGAVTNGGPANGAIDIEVLGTSLSWTAGTFNSFFDVYLGTDAGALAKIGTVSGATSFNLDAQSLIAGTTYFWKIDSGNVDVKTSGETWSFTTKSAVPEPGSLLALGTGLIGLLGVIRRKRS